MSQTQDHESGTPSDALSLWPSTPPTHDTIVLRQFRDADVAMAIQLGKDPYIPLIGSLPFEPTVHEAAEWIDRQRRSCLEGTRLSFAIAEAETDNAVGAIGLSLKDLTKGRTSVGYAVAPGLRHRGYATSALKALTEFAWTISNLHSIELYVEPWNHSSIHVAEAAGYEKEGLLRSHQEIGGQRRDMLLYAKTRG